MNLHFSAILFLLAPLTAQYDYKQLPKPVDSDAARHVETRDPDVPFRPAPNLDLEIIVDSGKLSMRATSTATMSPAFGIIVANCTGATLQFPGLPPLLEAHVVFVAGNLGNGLQWKHQFTGLPHDLYLQAGAISGDLMLFSKIAVVNAVDGR